ncbi:MAG TPA: hypothetical protein VJQ82_19170 [Terriglobales bacterium]|nr:hypothetical protein [Terriglobales bacterium]
MATVLESYDIDSPELGKTFKVDFAEGLDGVHLDFIEAVWGPLLKRQYNLALLHFFQLPKVDQTHEKWLEILGDFGVQDQHWDWRSKAGIAPGSNRRIFSLLNTSEVEAAMMLLFGKTSRDPSTPLPIVYVDYVAVAPWNRKVVQHPQRFKNLGTVMLGQAVATSIAEGLDGRCGLHSLPQSEGFYRRIGMSDFGTDPAYSSLRYFEFSAQAARNFVK